jgi:putative ABC transport system permease protein
MTKIVQQRTKEIGIRMALGARDVQVVRLVLGSSAGAMGIGLVFGFSASVAAASWLRSSLYGVSTLDPLAYGAVAALLIVTTLLATFVPARRASRIDSLIALRTE